MPLSSVSTWRSGQRSVICRKWVSEQTLTSKGSARSFGELTHRKRLGLMSKLFDFPDDGAEEAETAHRSPRTPSAHECEPAATGISQEGSLAPLQEHE